MPPEARRPLISANWKMNLNHLEAIQLTQKLAFNVKPDVFEAVEVSIHPPFTDLRTLQTLLEADRIPMALGAQHCHWDDSGAFTGEVSPTMLARLNVKYVLAGHSERRHLFGDTDENVAKRVSAIIKHGMRPIVCVGETLDQREAGATDDVVLAQLGAALKGRTAEVVSGLVVAYEPVWAIGTGRNATPDDAQATSSTIRSAIDKEWGADAAAAVRIQYGGSVKPTNAEELLSEPDIDGLLVGGASLDADGFARIVTAGKAGS